MSKKGSKRDIEKDKEVRKWYRRGYSTGQIAEYYGITRQAVHARLRAIGEPISLRRRAGKIADEAKKSLGRY